MINTKVKEVEAILDGKIILSPEEIILCQRAFHSTYEAIGMDANLDGAPITDIVECCFDYLDMYGHLPKDLHQKLHLWIQQELKPKNYKACIKKITAIMW